MSVSVQQVLDLAKEALLDNQEGARQALADLYLDCGQAGAAEAVRRPPAIHVLYLRRGFETSSDVEVTGWAFSSQEKALAAAAAVMLDLMAEDLEGADLAGWERAASSGSEKGRVALEVRRHIEEGRLSAAVDRFHAGWDTRVSLVILQAPVDPGLDKLWSASF